MNAPPVRPSHHVLGLDSLRFVAAMVVMLGHGAAFPLQSILSKEAPFGYFVLGVYGNLFYGPAAVILFFVISGFCIHYPYRDLKRGLGLRHFLIGRYVRIGIPMLVIAGAYVRSFWELRSFHDSILWSLAAELIYYTLYPLLRLGFRRWGIVPLIVVSYAAAFAVILLSPGRDYYANYGIEATWILGLPSWLLGCLIAERHGTYVAPSAQQVWRRRGSVLVCACMVSVLQFHSTIKDPWTLPVLSLLLYLWLRDEIAYYNSGERRPWTWLEKAGAWSYSLYLCHLPARAFFMEHAPEALRRPDGWLLPVAWTATMGFVMLACWLFYLAVELPSHKLARVFRKAFPRYR